MKSRTDRFVFRRLRVRRKVTGVPERPRLSVFKSLKHVYAQIINDVEGRTLVAASSRDKGVAQVGGTKAAAVVGETLGKKALAKGIKEVVFDRAGRRYHGVLKVLADNARQAGLKF